MPILFVVKRSRARLLPVLKRLLEKPGLSIVLLDRRSGRERRKNTARANPSEDRRRYCRRQPLDLNGSRTWAELGFFVLKVRALPEAPAASAGSRAAKRRRARPAARR